MASEATVNRRFFMKAGGTAALAAGAATLPAGYAVGHTSISMTYNLDEDFNRIGAGTSKWDRLRARHRPHEIKYPMGVADMDFRTCPHVTQALAKRMGHQNWGYEAEPADYYDNIIAWNKKRYGQVVKPGSILHCLGVLDGVLSILKNHNPDGNKVMIHTPGYSGFFGIINAAQYEALENPLKLINGRYEMDYDLMTRQIDEEDVKVFLFCNPQNPTGNCWTAEEMRRMGDICNDKGVLVIADEIHCDFVNKHAKYTPYANIGDQYAQNSFTLKSTSKSFSLASHCVGYMFSDNQEYIDNLRANGHIRFRLSALSMIACNAAYKHGATYMDDVQAYIDKNCHIVANFCAEHMPDVKYQVHEGTYLAWLDCSAVGEKLGGATSEKNIGTIMSEFFVEKAGVYIGAGEYYGSNGAGYLRMNLGTTHKNVLGALSAMKLAIDNI